MQDFLNTIIEGEKFELLIDVNIFPKDIILKTAYTYLDKGYFLFKYNNEGNIIMQFSKKDDQNIDPQVIIANFTDSLLESLLRDQIEKNNKVIRETIVEKAINWPLDTKNFVSYDENNTKVSNQVDFDKDIDDILSEIENDPELKIDEEEIQSILKEIETESNNTKPEITVDTSAVANLKEKFNKQ